MTIFEAIKHCKDRAKKCDECGAEHRQLQEWMEELLRYREIGTVEECREAMEKQIPKQPRDIEYDYSYFICDNCGVSIYIDGEFDGHHYCLNCGQAIEWPDMNLEGMKDE